MTAGPAGRDSSFTAGRPTGVSRRTAVTALAGVLVAPLLLAGCGKKGGPLTPTEARLRAEKAERDAAKKQAQEQAQERAQEQQAGSTPAGTATQE